MSGVEEDLVDQLFNSSEKRLARVLLLMASFGKEGKPEPVIAKINQETLAEIIGTTRSRVSTFMNRFRELGLINYNGDLEVHNSLLNVILHDNRRLTAATPENRQNRSFLNSGICPQCVDLTAFSAKAPVQALGRVGEYWPCRRGNPSHSVPSLTVSNKSNLQHPVAQTQCGSYRMFRPDGSLLQHHQCPMADVLRTGVSVREQEVHIERPNGSRGVALVNIEAIKDRRGNIVGAVNCFQDITERKRNEEAAQRLAAIVESSDDAIVSKNLDGIITSWNAGAERIFGYLAEEIVGKPITILIPPDHQREEEGIMQRIRRGQRVEHYETVRQRKHGSLIDVSLTISPVKNTQGKITGASKIARDITEHKRNEAQIVNLAHEAEHRTKNILATVQATVRLSHSSAADDLKKLIEGRINALAKVHTLFVESRWTGAELHTLVTQELLPYRGDRETRVRINGPAVMLEPNTAQTIAVFLHELATNAAKYGSLSTADGDVEIAWSCTADRRLNLRWTESGGPAVAPPTHRGFGTRILENIIGGQLKGKVRFDWRAQGLTCEIALPLHRPHCPTD
jgi:PAS domain S-box-containing protein